MLIPEGYAQVNMKWTGSAFPSGAETTFGVNWVSPDTPTTVAQTVADEWENAQLDNLQVDTIELSSVLVKFGPNETGPAVDLPIGLPGLDSGTASPPNVALLAVKGTDFGGRQGRGRMFIPGLRDVDVLVGGAVESTQLSVWVTRLETFRAALATADMPMVLLHAGPDGSPGPYDVTSLVPASRVATQRRRLRR